MTASALPRAPSAPKVAIKRFLEVKKGRAQTNGKGTASAVPLGTQKIPGFSP